MNQIPNPQQDGNGPYFNVGNDFGNVPAPRSQGNKRKSEDKDNPPDGNQGRAKRNRYIRSVPAGPVLPREKIQCRGSEYEADGKMVPASRATSANGARSGAMAIHPASGAISYRSIAYSRRTEVVQTSRIRSEYARLP